MSGRTMMAGNNDFDMPVALVAGWWE